MRHHRFTKILQSGKQTKNKQPMQTEKYKIKIKKIVKVRALSEGKLEESL